MSVVSSITFSEQFEIPKEMVDELGIFDRFMYIDSAYYIERRLLYKNKYFRGADKHINKYINSVVSSKSNIVKYINKNNKMFNEACDIGLGLSLESKKGRGTGKQLLEILKNILIEAYDYNISGLENLVVTSSLLVDGISRDKTSDFIANIIRDDIVNYTKLMCKKLGIEYNKLEGKLLLPKDILVDIPLDDYWSRYKNNITFELLYELLNNKGKTLDYIRDKTPQQKKQLYTEIIQANEEKQINHINSYNRKTVPNDIKKVIPTTLDNICNSFESYRCTNKTQAIIVLSRLSGCCINTQNNSININGRDYYIDKVKGKYEIIM